MYFEHKSTFFGEVMLNGSITVIGFFSIGTEGLIGPCRILLFNGFALILNLGIY